MDDATAAVIYDDDVVRVDVATENLADIMKATPSISHFFVSVNHESLDTVLRQVTVLAPCITLSALLLFGARSVYSVWA
jgi:hypothetical protein